MVVKGVRAGFVSSVASSTFFFLLFLFFSSFSFSFFFFFFFFSFFFFFLFSFFSRPNLVEPQSKSFERWRVLGFEPHQLFLSFSYFIYFFSSSFCLSQWSFCSFFFKKNRGHYSGRCGSSLRISDDKMKIICNFIHYYQVRLKPITTASNAPSWVLDIEDGACVDYDLCRSLFSFFVSLFVFSLPELCIWCLAIKICAPVKRFVCTHTHTHKWIQKQKEHKKKTNKCMQLWWWWWWKKEFGRNCHSTRNKNEEKLTQSSDQCSKEYEK